MRDRLAEKLVGARVDHAAADKALEDEERKELQQADNDYQMRKKEVMDDLEGKYLKREGAAIAKIREEQVDDRKRILVKYLPDDNDIQGIISEIDNEERAALRKFQKELQDQQKEHE